MYFSDSSKSDITYNTLSTSSDIEQIVEPLNGVGDNAVVATDQFNIYGFRNQTVIFQRCNSVVYAITNADTVNYAERLDSRLSELVCP